MLPHTNPLPPLPKPLALLLGPSQPLQRLHPARLWTVAAPVMLLLLLSTSAAHAQGRPADEPTTGSSCEVCIPADYAEACEEAADDAQAYWGEAKAMRRAHADEQERSRRLAVEAELARRDREAALARGWWMFAGGSAAATVLLVAVYALAN